MAAAIGIATPFVSYLDRFLLRPSPFPDSGSVVLVRLHEGVSGRELMALPREVEEFRHSPGVFREVSGFGYGGSVVPDSGGMPIAVCRLQAAGFLLLGVAPVIGRHYTAQEERAQELVAVISDNLWHRQYGRTPDVLGSEIVLGRGLPYRVIGVMPREFRFPDSSPDVWIPFPPTGGQIAHMKIVGRVHRGVSLETAQGMGRAALQRMPGRKEAEMTLVRLDDELKGVARRSAPLVVVAVIAALLLSSSVICYVLLGDALSADVEMGVRMALGASRLRAFSVFPLQGFFVALAGTALGIVVAGYLSRVRGLHVLHRTAAMLDGFDARVLIAMFGVALSAGLAAGGVAVLRMRARSVQSLLGSGGASSSKRTNRTRLVLGAAQIACATLFCVLAALSWASFVNIKKVSPGFRPDRLLTAQVVIPSLFDQPFERRDVEQRVERYHDLSQRILQALEDLPGASLAAVTSGLPILSPITGYLSFSAGAPTPECDRGAFRAVSDNYFETLGLRLKEGRSFNAADRPNSERIAIVNQKLAAGCWPDSSAVGRTGVLIGEKVRIVGVVEDVPMLGRRKPPEPEVYMPLSQFPSPITFVVVRVEGDDPYAALPALRARIRGVDSEANVLTARSMEDILSESEGPLTVRAGLMSAASVSTILIAVLGVYAAATFSSRERRRERAIRVALGATPRRLLLRSTLDTVTWSLPGLAAGLGLAYWAASSLGPVLFGVSRFEPSLYGGSAVLLSCIAALSSWLGGLDLYRIDLLRYLHSD
jgi:predicted permease